MSLAHLNGIKVSENEIFFMYLRYDTIMMIQTNKNVVKKLTETRNTLKNNSVVVATNISEMVKAIQSTEKENETPRRHELVK